MDRALAIAQLRALGLSVSKMGRVSDTQSDLDYGVLTNLDLQTTDGRFIPFDGLTSFRWVQAENDLFATDSEGNETRIHGDYLSDRDKEVIEIRSMPKTLSQLTDVFEEIYPEAESMLFYDELNEQDMVDMAMFGMPEEGLRSLSDKILKIYFYDLEKRLDMLGFVGTSYPSETVRANTLDVVTYRNRRNLFREWVESHPWDGVPRVRTWFMRLFGATAPPLQAEGLEETYLGNVSEMWFVGAVRRQYTETKHEIVPVLIGDQGIGKGNALKFMAGQDSWYTESTEKVENTKDFLDSVRGTIIVELSEATQLRSSDADNLKAFISKSADNIRKPYARYNEHFPRHFVFVATSNLDNIFTDITGNRRFFPMYCDGTRSEELTHYDVEQVWAEALVMYKEGHLWYTDEDTAAIAQVMQDFGTQENTNIMTIDSWLDDPMNGYAEVGSVISKQMILDQVFSVDPQNTHTMVPREIVNAFNAWANGNRCWRKMAKTIRIGGRVCRAYERVAAPGETPTINRLKMSCVSKLDFTDPASVMRRICMRYNCGNAGDIFPHEKVSSQELESLVQEGYVYSIGLGDSVIYKTGFLP